MVKTNTAEKDYLISIHRPRYGCRTRTNASLNKGRPFPRFISKHVYYNQSTKVEIDAILPIDKASKRIALAALPKQQP